MKFSVKTFLFNKYPLVIDEFKIKRNNYKNNKIINFLYPLIIKIQLKKQIKKLFQFEVLIKVLKNKNNEKIILFVMYT